MARSTHLQTHTAPFLTLSAPVVAVAGPAGTDGRPLMTLGGVLPCPPRAIPGKSMAANKYLFTKRHQTTRKASFRLKIRAKWLLCHTVQRGGCPGATRLPREVANLSPYQPLPGHKEN